MDLYITLRIIFRIFLLLQSVSLIVLFSAIIAVSGAERFLRLQPQPQGGGGGQGSWIGGKHGQGGGGGGQKHGGGGGGQGRVTCGGGAHGCGHPPQPPPAPPNKNAGHLGINASNSRDTAIMIPSSCLLTEKL